MSDTEKVSNLISLSQNILNFSKVVFFINEIENCENISFVNIFLYKWFLRLRRRCCMKKINYSLLPF